MCTSHRHHECGEPHWEPLTQEERLLKKVASLGDGRREVVPFGDRGEIRVITIGRREACA